MEQNDQSTEAHFKSAGFGIVIDGREVRISEGSPTGREVLSSAGIECADDAVLIQLLRPGTRSIGLDEAVDLHPEGKEAFRTFRSDRIFRFTIDGHGYEWGAVTIDDSELRNIADLDCDHVLVLRRDGSDREVGPGDRVDLNAPGTEHLRTAKRIITVYLNGVDKDHEKRIAAGTYTTEDLIRALGVDAGYLLNVVNAEGELVPLQPGHRLHVKPGMKFVSQVPGGGSS